VNDGDRRRQQLHHDGARVGAVQALDVEVLLLRRLKNVIKVVQFPGI
jgi:hypothetical protein